LSEQCDFVVCACCGYESGESEFRKLTQELKEIMQTKMFLSWDLFCQETGTLLSWSRQSQKWMLARPVGSSVMVGSFQDNNNGIVELNHSHVLKQ
jgi:hypothetical protein